MLLAKHGKDSMTPMTAAGADGGTGTIGCRLQGGSGVQCRSPAVLQCTHLDEMARGLALAPPPLAGAAVERGKPAAAKCEH
jgi:hypothetical protein